MIVKRRELEEIMPKTTQSTLCRVEAKVSNSVLMVRVSEECIGKIKACTLNHFYLIGEVLIEVCSLKKLCTRRTSLRVNPGWTA